MSVEVNPSPESSQSDSSVTRTTKKERFAVLDGMRGVAALFIVTIHTGALWHFDFPRGYLAVDLFFVLSGFVIAHSYDARLASSLSASEFIKIRLIRLMPFVYLSVPISIAHYITLHHEPKYIALVVLSGISSLFLVPSYVPGTDFIFPINPPIWSLFYEVIVNTVYAFIRPKLTRRTLIAIVATAWIMMCFFCIRSGKDESGHSWNVISFLTGLSRSMFGIFLGIGLYHIRSRFDWIGKVKFAPWLAILLLPFLLGSQDFGWFNPYADLLIVVVFFPALVIMGAQRAHETSSYKWLLVLGSISYPLYLLHVSSGRLFEKLTDHIHVPFPWIRGIVFLALMIPLCLWLEKAYDIPVRKRLSKRFLVKVPDTK